MKIEKTSASPTTANVDAVVIGCWSDEPLSGAAAAVDDATNGKIGRLIEQEEISTSRCAVTLIPGIDEIQAKVLVVVGLGDRSEANSSISYQAAGAASKMLASRQRDEVAYYLEVDSMADAVCGSMVGCQGQDLYRAEKTLNPPNGILWSCSDQAQFDAGIVLGQSMNLTRRLVNEPANEIYPETFANECQKMSDESGLECEIWDQAKLEQEKCGALLAVARGSEFEPRLVIMKYKGGTDDQKPLTLVGKGVTFDSGGLSLKPSEAMVDMKCDMTGAATVVGAIRAIAHLKLPVNVTAIVGCVENMISGRSYRLGDVLTARNGKTIEVHNTDAEGRLVLADALCVAVEQGAGKLVDLATLTGACMVALGRNTAGVMTNDQTWCDEVKKASESCGEAVWQLPMFDEFSEHIKSSVADIKNVGDGRWGGAMTAAKLLEEFVNGTPWTHIDIAGPSFADKPTAWIDAGASGCFVRTLVGLAKLY